MPSLNDPNNFAGRVAYAASVISEGRPTSRNFNNCFENHDGDEVAAILVRRAESNPRLAANLWRYLGKDSVMDAVERLKDIPTRQMAAHAAVTRERCRREFDEMMAKREAEAEAMRQRGRDAGYSVEKSGPFEWTIRRPDGSALNVKPSLERDAWRFAGDDAAKASA